MKRRIAVPLEGGVLCSHFGHSEQFAIMDTDDKTVTGESRMVPPPHEHGVLPRWLAEKGVTDVIAGGMGQGARDILSRHSIRVFSGAPVKSPAELAEDLLNDRLVTGVNNCHH
jgi:predicted Fe-Mo cluster-binding NifX family protein